MAYKSGPTIRSMVTKVNPQQPLEERTGVIYIIPCSVTKVYIGETSRTLFPSMML